MDWAGWVSLRPRVLERFYGQDASAVRILAFREEIVDALYVAMGAVEDGVNDSTTVFGRKGWSSQLEKVLGKRS